MAKSTLELALQTAIKTCNSAELEEEGGVILRHPDSVYMFIKIANENSGTPVAQGLFTANRTEFATKVMSTFKDGWRMYASFHTHPQFSINPSRIDMTELFMGFPINYIYSNKTKELAKYVWINEGTAVKQELVDYE